MPDQNNSTQNPNPTTPPADAPVAPSVPPMISPQTDIPPLPPAFQNLPEEGTPTTDKDNGSAAPPDISSVLPKAKKKFGGGRIIATILGLFVLIGGVGAGIVLTQQQQLFQQKASVLLPCVSEAGGQCFPSSDICTGTSVANTDCPTGQKCVVGGTCSTSCSPGAQDSTSCTTDQSCPGKQYRSCSSSGTWGSYGTCQDIADNCPARTFPPAGSPTAAPGPGCGSPGDQCSTQACCSAYTCDASTHKCVAPATGGTPQCTRIPGSYVSANGGNITITQKMVTDCTNACPAGTSDAPHVYASKFHCDGINLAAGCQDNGTIISVPAVGQSISVPAPSCGTVQVDVGCKNNANTWGNFIFSTRIAATACNTATTPPGSPTAPPTAPSCIAVKAYTGANWVLLNEEGYSFLKTGDVVNFCVSGNAASGTFDKAQFMVNTTLEPETTTKRPSSTDFCQSYTILSTDTTISVKAKIHSSTGVWVGESI